MIGNGKLVEDLKVNVLSNTAYATAGTYFNGNAAASTTLANASAVDTQDYDEALIVVSPGTINTGVSLVNTVVAGSTAVASSASAISGAVFTTVTPSATSAQVGQLRVADQARYMWLRTVMAGSATGYQDAVVILGKGPAQHPISNSAVFDV